MNSGKESKKSNGRGGARPGSGRPKGALDHGNAAIRELIVMALDKVGGVDYLATVAASHPPAFLALIGKVMPLQVTGAEGQPLVPPTFNFVRSAD
jgi:hypothetical protein